MNVARTLVTLFVTLVSYIAINATAAQPVNNLAPMLQKVLPAVVNIRADIKITDITTLSRLERERGNFPPGTPIPDRFLSVASGVIVDAVKGYILTNAHVIEDAQTITVTLSDNRHYTAKLIGLDKPFDIALLQIKAKNLTAIPFGDSNKLNVGDNVETIGNPFGLNQTVTSGIVSALGRANLGIESNENFIQIDAPINPGNSGGALLNQTGQLIGINTAILSPERGSIGIGFAIPINMAKSIMDQLIQYGDVKRGVLGIGAQDITPDLANALDLASLKGAVVTLVRGDTPAQKAGMEIGDIITSINGVDVKNSNDVVNTVSLLRVDSKVNINIIRDKKPMVLSTVLIDSKKIKEMSEKVDPFLYGVALKNFSLYSPFHGAIKGVLVVSVEEDSHAWQADLRAGDVILSANRQRVVNVDDLQKRVAESKDSVLLNVLRGAGAIFLVITKES